MRIVAALVLILIHWSEALACERPTFTLEEQDFTGRLVTLSGLSPPNRANVTDADSPKFRWYLQLEKPICDARDKPHYLIELLNLGSDDFARYHHLLDTDVQVTGKLGEWAAPIYDVPFDLIVVRLMSLHADRS